MWEMPKISRIYSASSTTSFTVSYGHAIHESMLQCHSQWLVPKCIVNHVVDVKGEISCKGQCDHAIVEIPSLPGT